MRLLRPLLPLLTVLLLTGCFGRERYVRMEGFAQGGTWHIICSLPAGTQPAVVRDSIDRLLLEIDGSLSGYNRGSLLSRLNAGEELPLDDHFLVNFRLSEQYWRESQGAFDPSAAPLFDLWGFGFKEAGAMPTQRQIDSVRTLIGMDRFRIDTLDDGTFRLRKADPRCRLNFNAIAQGYTCDRVAIYLDAVGSSNYLVEVGREILCKGLSPRGDEWKIAVEKPAEEHRVLAVDRLHVQDWRRLRVVRERDAASVRVRPNLHLVAVRRHRVGGVRVEPQRDRVRAGRLFGQLRTKRERAAEDLRLATIGIGSCQDHRIVPVLHEIVSRRRKIERNGDYLRFVSAEVYVNESAHGARDLVHKTARLTEKLVFRVLRNFGYLHV